MTPENWAKAKANLYGTKDKDGNVITYTNLKEECTTKPANKAKGTPEMMTCPIKLSKVNNVGKPGLSPSQQMGGFIVPKYNNPLGSRMSATSDN